MMKRFETSAAYWSMRISRRALLGYAAVVTAMVLVGTRRSRAQQKMSQQEAEYQDSPKDGQKCADCQFFVEGGTCQVVEGQISPDGWCVLFAPKS